MTPAIRPGLGIVGMRERAAASGGTIEVGPRARGGFLVRMRVPLRVDGSPRDPAPAIRVLLVDDHAVMRAGFRMILETADDITVVGEAATAPRRWPRHPLCDPDVICMDIQMPDMDGLEATRRIVADAALHAAVVIVTTFDRDDYLFQALAAGASGFLLKNAGPEELISAVRVAAAGDALLAPEVTRRVIARFAAAARRHRPDPGAAAPTARRALARRAHRPRGRGAAARRRGPQQRRDRAAALHRRGDGQDARVERAAEARRPRPRGGGRLRPPPRAWPADAATRTSRRLGAGGVSTRAIRGSGRDGHRRVAVDERVERVEVAHEERGGVVVGDLAVLAEQAGARLHVALGLTERRRVVVAEDGLQVLLRGGGRDARRPRCR